MNCTLSVDFCEELENKFVLVSKNLKIGIISEPEFYECKDMGTYLHRHE